VLPTLAVILLAYGMHVLFSFWFQRQGGYLRRRSRGGKLNWVTLVGSIGAGVGLIYWCCLSPGKNDQRLQLAGFLGTVYAEGWPGQVDQFKYPPVDRINQASGKQPVYALLHPGTPVTQVAPEKKLPRPRPSRVSGKGPSVHARDKSGKTAKLAKARASRPKRGKMAGKTRAKKKKQPAVTPGRDASAG
jgi:hypothetical protein